MNSQIVLDPRLHYTHTHTVIQNAYLLFIILHGIIYLETYIEIDVFKRKKEKIQCVLILLCILFNLGLLSFIHLIYLCNS